MGFKGVKIIWPCFRDEHYIYDNAKPMHTVKTMTNEPGRFQINRYKTVLEIAHSRYPPSVSDMKSKKGITLQGETRRKNENMGPLIFHADAVYKIAGS